MGVAALEAVVFVAAWAMLAWAWAAVTQVWGVLALLAAWGWQAVPEQRAVLGELPVQQLWVKVAVGNAPQAQELVKDAHSIELKEKDVIQVNSISAVIAMVITTGIIMGTTAGIMAGIAVGAGAMAAGAGDGPVACGLA
jgi:endonuclease/exonuclease/phosphatase (EEP) superfamily protein YafD